MPKFVSYSSRMLDFGTLLCKAWIFTTQIPFIIYRIENTPIKHASEGILYNIQYWCVMIQYWKVNTINIDKICLGH